MVFHLLSGVTGEMLYWEVVRRLEGIGVKVYSYITFICYAGRLMGKKEEMKHGVVYKTDNRYCQERYLHFMFDMPHLIKTTRNCWYSSRTGDARYMWGKDLLLSVDFIVAHVSMHVQMYVFVILWFHKNGIVHRDICPNF